MCCMLHDQCIDTTPERFWGQFTSSCFYNESSKPTKMQMTENKNIVLQFVCLFFGVVQLCSFWLPPSYHSLFPPKTGCQSNMAGGGRDRWRSGKGGGLSTAGTQSASIYMCLYILWWIYDQMKHRRQLQMDGIRFCLSICLSSKQLCTV